MAYNTLSHWALGIVWNSEYYKKNNVSGEGKTEIQLASFSEIFCVLVFRILDDGQSPETQCLQVLYTIVRTLQNVRKLDH
jgi:hypothetical protein